MSLRSRDNQSEKAVAQFLDENFYPVMVKNFERFGDTETQLNGIDVRFDLHSDKNLLVDEKAAAHFVNKAIPTFAFELDFIGADGNLKPGWLIDTGKATQYYLLVWIWAAKEIGFSKADIEKLEVLLVSRKSILKIFESYNVNSSRLNRIAEHMRLGEMYGTHFKNGKRPFYFSLTKHLDEKPCNVIIHKRKLVQLGVLHKIVTTSSTV